MNILCKTNKTKFIFSLLVLIFLFASVLCAQEKKDALKIYKAGDYVQAISICEDEIAQNPNNIDSYVVLLWALIANKQYLEAELWAVKARNISPYNQYVIESLAEAKYYLGKNDEALTAFQDYISLVQFSGSKIGQVYYFMGEIYIRKGNFYHADIAFSQAVRNEPLKDMWWTRLGYAQEMSRYYKLASLSYEKAYSLNPQNLEAKTGKKRVMTKIR